MPKAGSSRKYFWIAGIGVAAAALIVYFSLNWPPIPGKQVQGAIGSRDVYRQAQIADKDVGVAGQPKVTTDDLKRLVASPQFRELASNANFQQLIGSHQLTQLNSVSGALNQSFAIILQNPGFQGLFQSAQFHQLEASPAFHSLLLSGAQANSAQVIALANQHGLSGNAAGMVVQLVSNTALNQLLANPGFSQLCSNPNFTALMNNAAMFQFLQMPGVVQFASMTPVQNLANQGQLNSIIGNNAMQTQLFVHALD